MGDSDQNETGSRPSTRFRWNYGSKEGREVFGLETTINGDPTDAELGGDIASVIKALGPARSTRLSADVIRLAMARR